MNNMKANLMEYIPAVISLTSLLLADISHFFILPRFLNAHLFIWQRVLSKVT